MIWLVGAAGLLAIYIGLDDVTTDRVAKWMAFVVIGILFVSALAGLYR